MLKILCCDNIKAKRNYVTLLLFAFLFLFSDSLFALSKNAMPNFKPGEDFVPGQLIVLMTDGPCFYCAPGYDKWERMEVGMSLTDGYSIRTGEHGYIALSWSEDNVIFIKPVSGLRVNYNPNSKDKIELELHYAEVMVSSRDSGGMVHLKGRHINSYLLHGEMIFISEKKCETLKALSGNSTYKLSGNIDYKPLYEQYYFEVDENGKEGPVRKFDQQSEYHSFRRFSSLLQRFNEFHTSHSNDFHFKLNEIMINNQYYNEMRKDNDRCVIETPDGKIPKTILFQAKFIPYPSELYKFEMTLGHELVYVFRQGRNGYHEVNFPIPSVPDFNVTVHYVNAFDRRVPIFRGSFTIQNKRMGEAIARDFCKNLSKAMSRRDSVWIRNHLSDKYRDNVGNDKFNFIKSSDNAFREYRDIRLYLTPFRFEFREGKIKIRVNYRLSALTSTWKYRYERNGTEILTIVPEDGEYKLLSKTSGLYFNMLKITCDLRRAILQGRIIDDLTGYPVKGADVQVIGTPYHTVTDSMGEYIIHNIPPGDYSVKCSKNGYGILSTFVTLSPAALSR